MLTFAVPAFFVVTKAYFQISLEETLWHWFFWVATGVLLVVAGLLYWLAYPSVRRFGAVALPLVVAGVVVVDRGMRRYQSPVIAPFPSGVLGVMVLPFRDSSGEVDRRNNDAQDRIVTMLSRRFDALAMEADVRKLPRRLESAGSSDEINRTAQNMNARLVVWGSVRDGEALPLVSVAGEGAENYVPVEPGVALPGKPGELAAVNDCFDVKLPRFSDDPSAFAFGLVGLCFYMRGEYARALSYVSNAIERGPDDVWSKASMYRLRGNVRVRVGQYKDAVVDYSAALDADPTDVCALNNRGNLYYYQRKYATAALDYSAALAQGENVTTLHNRGLAYQENRDLDDAVDDFSRVIELLPDSRDAYVNRARAFYTLDNFDAAISDYSKAIELSADDAVSYFGRANAHREKKAYAESIRDYDAALAIDPGFADALYNKAVVCEWAARLTESVETFETFLEYVESDDAPRRAYAKSKIREIKKSIQKESPGG